MSHHFDYPAGERLDISDAYCFAGASDGSGPRTVFGMNASPTTGTPWDPAGYYELKVDTNEDYVEDITWRFTFPVDSAGTQHVQVAELTGKEPNTTSFWNFAQGPAQVNINATVPLDDLAGRPASPASDPASGVWGQLRDQTAAVVAAGGTFKQGAHGRPTALAYGAWVADTLLPNVLPFTPGTNALWDPWHGSHNGKGLTEDSGDNVTRMVLNQDFTSGLTQPGPLLDYFPYLCPPPES